MESIDKIAATAPVVAAARAELDASHEDVLAGETALLERVVELVRPALKAISSRVAVFGGEKVNQFFYETEYAQWRGISLAQDKPGPKQKLVGTINDSGPFEGWDLFLADDGTFRELEYTGRWTKWVDQDSTYRAVERVMTAREVADEYDVEPMLGRIARAIEQQCGDGMPKRTTKNVERAARLRAVVTLLG